QPERPLRRMPGGFGELEGSIAVDVDRGPDHTEPAPRSCKGRIEGNGGLVVVCRLAERYRPARSVIDLLSPQELVVRRDVAGGRGRHARGHRGRGQLTLERRDHL